MIMCSTKQDGRKKKDLSVIHDGRKKKGLSVIHHGIVEEMRKVFEVRSINYLMCVCVCVCVCVCMHAYVCVHYSYVAIYHSCMHADEVQDVSIASLILYL